MARNATQTKTQISVLVADFSRMSCQLLASALAHSRYNLNVVATPITCAEALDSMRTHNPDVALVSANLQDGPLMGFRVLQELSAASPKTRAVVLMESSQRDLVIDAFRAGASGIFCRTDSIERLGKCLSSVHSGQIWASSRELQYLLETLSQAIPLRVVGPRTTNLLTRRESQVVRLVAEGLTNREISRKLSLSEHTVKNYLFKAYDKLGVSTRVELTLYALSQSSGFAFPEGQ